MNKALTPEEALNLRRLRFRSAHRGCKETDLVLGGFAEAALESLSAPQLEAYAALLEETDADIWDWLVEKKPPPRPDYSPLLAQLRRFRP